VQIMSLGADHVCKYRSGPPPYRSCL